MYIMKIKGNGKIPNYLQVRDESFTLIAYFRADKARDGFIKAQMPQYIEEVEKFLPEMEFGVLMQIEDK